VVLKRNVGGFDRGFRVVVGLGVIGAGMYFRSWWGAVGAIPLLTGLFARCPVYLPFGTSTCEERPTAGTGAARPPLPPTP
jgi:hypothetical protein